MEERKKIREKHTDEKNEEEIQNSHREARLILETQDDYLEKISHSLVNLNKHAQDINYEMEEQNMLVLFRISPSSFFFLESKFFIFFQIECWNMSITEQTEFQQS